MLVCLQIWSFGLVFCPVLSFHFIKLECLNVYFSAPDALTHMIPPNENYHPVIVSTMKPPIKGYAAPELNLSPEIQKGLMHELSKYLPANHYLPPLSSMSKLLPPKRVNVGKSLSAKKPPSKNYILPNVSEEGIDFPFVFCFWSSFYCHFSV